MSFATRPVIAISDNAVRKLRFAPYGYQFYRDATMPGFYVRVGTTVKSFTVQKALPAKHGGRLILYCIGRAGEITADDARAKAVDLLARIGNGEDVLATEGRRYTSASVRKAAAAAKVRAIAATMPPPLEPAEMVRPSGFLAPKRLPVFADLLDSLPHSRHVDIARYLEVGEDAIARWKAKGAAPHAVMLALYWESNYGRTNLYTSLVNEAMLHRQLADSLGREVKRLQAVVDEFQRQGDYETANSPIFGTLSKAGPLPVAPQAPQRARKWAPG